MPLSAAAGTRCHLSAYACTSPHAARRRTDAVEDPCLGEPGQVAAAQRVHDQRASDEDEQAQEDGEEHLLLRLLAGLLRSRRRGRGNGLRPDTSNAQARHVSAGELTRIHVHVHPQLTPANERMWRPTPVPYDVSPSHTALVAPAEAISAAMDPAGPRACQSVRRACVPTSQCGPTACHSGGRGCSHVEHRF